MYKIKKSVIWKIVDDEVVILSIDTDDYFCGNDFATEIWKMIDKKYPEEKIIKAACDKYDAPAAKITKDVKAFIKSMCKAGLIE